MYLLRRDGKYRDSTRRMRRKKMFVKLPAILPSVHMYTYTRLELDTKPPVNVTKLCATIASVNSDNGENSVAPVESQRQTVELIHYAKVNR